MLSKLKCRGFRATSLSHIRHFYSVYHVAKEKKVQVCKDQEKAQSEITPKTEVGKNKLTIRHLYHETYRKPNEQLFSQKVATQLP